MSEKQDHSKKSNSEKNRTPISGHTRTGSSLIPPLLSIEGMKPTSWMDNRLPEMIWASLILSSSERNYALAQLRRFLDFVGKHSDREKLADITLTGISVLETPLREELISFLIEPPSTGEALATLRLFESLPALDSWNQLLPDVEPDVGLLMDAVGSTLWHQSQQATDCRWVRLMARVLSEKWHIPPEIAEEWLGYPEVGDQRKVRPSIRAAEISLDEYGSPDLTWPRAFWEEGWRNTPCFGRAGSNPTIPNMDATITRQRIHEIVELLGAHWENTHSSASTDAKHDAVFGMAFYSLRVLDELMGIAIGSSIIGRLALRTILEVRIDLHYMTGEDDDQLWKKWRQYGAGQGKLNALKFDDKPDIPTHIDIESIERIASEDIWEEFLPVELASWSNSNLRQLSEISGLKETYDRHYSWTSGYAHGMWGPIRESCYETCMNPLHRLHRFPSRQILTDVVDDAAILVDEILDDLNAAYPSFIERLIPSNSRQMPG